MHLFLCPYVQDQLLMTVMPLIFDHLPLTVAPISLKQNRITTSTSLPVEWHFCCMSNLGAAKNRDLKLLMPRSTKNTPFCVV